MTLPCSYGNILRCLVVTCGRFFTIIIICIVELAKGNIKEMARWPKLVPWFEIINQG